MLRTLIVIAAAIAFTAIVMMMAISAAQACSSFYRGYDGAYHRDYNCRSYYRSYTYRPYRAYRSYRSWN